MAASKLTIQDSPIHGVGVFAARHIQANYILMAEGGPDWNKYFQSMNHQVDGNVLLLVRKGARVIVALGEIDAGSEITANYLRKEFEYNEWLPEPWVF